jgi:tRNA-splicing ligase RtcB
LDALALRLDRLRAEGQLPRFADKITQLGSYGGGNHFGECEVVQIADSPRAREIARVFGLVDGHVAFLSHCGSRGFGYQLANGEFARMRAHFQNAGIPYPGGDRDLVHAELGTKLADDYLDDMALGANFATVNHMLINAMVWEAFREVFPGIKAELVYFISHNIARLEDVEGEQAWVHRKGATRAFPAHHPALAGTPFEATGHPILLPGNPKQGSVVMVAEPGAKQSLYSVNHGAGRAMGRRAAIKALSQRDIDEEFARRDILTNCRCYPRDEAPAAYKDFREVLKSVELAGLARSVARLDARFVIKDANKADD